MAKGLGAVCLLLSLGWFLDHRASRDALVACAVDRETAARDLRAFKASAQVESAKQVRSVQQLSADLNHCRGSLLTFKLEHAPKDLLAP